MSSAARRRLRAARLPVALLVAYTGFSYLSIAWAQARGDAVDGANRTAVYAAVFALFVALPLRAPARLLLLASWAAGVICESLVRFLHASAADGPRGFFILGRFASPITYPDAEAAMLLMAALMLVVVAAGRSYPAAVRAAAAALSCVGVELAIMSQSRGSLAAFPLALILSLALSGNALRLLAAEALVGVAVAPTVPTLLHVYTAVVGGSGYDAALADARTAIGLSAVATAAAAALLAFLDRRRTVPPDAVRAIRRIVVVTVVVAGAAAVAGAFLFADPVGRGRHAWHAFTTNAAAPPETIHLASGLGTSRYDVWRIAIHQFAAHPLGGVGADNYLIGYLHDRHSVETARYPESVVLRALSETGLVGGALFFCFLGLTLFWTIRAVRRHAPLGPAVVAAVGVAYWLLHSSVDWFWEFPALTAPALAFLALACTERVTDPPPPQGTRRHLVAGAAALTGAVTAGVLLCCWIAVRNVDRAVAAPTPARAYALLAAARRWNPLSEQPRLTEAAVAANDLDRSREIAALQAALRQNPHDWYAHLMIGIAEGRLGNLDASRRELARARKLSPLEPLVIYAQNNLAVGNPLSEREIAEAIRIRSSTLRGVRQR